MVLAISLVLAIIGIGLKNTQKGGVKHEVNHGSNIDT